MCDAVNYITTAGIKGDIDECVVRKGGSMIPQLRLRFASPSNSGPLVSSGHHDLTWKPLFTQ